MDDSFLVRVLNCMTNLNEKVQTLLGRERVLIAVFRDFDPADELHHEIRPPRLCRSCVKHLRDVRMIHHRERLAFSLEPSDHALGVHARFDDFQRDTTTNWFAIVLICCPEKMPLDRLQERSIHLFMSIH